MQISFRQQRFDTGDIIFLLIHTLHNDRMDNRIDSGGKTLIRDARSSIRLPVQGFMHTTFPLNNGDTASRFVTLLNPITTPTSIESLAIRK